MSYENPWDAADNPETNENREYYGQAQVDTWFCVLEKGRGKVPFDAAQHKVEDRRTAIKVSVIPLPEMNISRDVFREYIAEFGPWPKITLPSVKAINQTVRGLNNTWVKVAFVPEGRQYVSKTSGETKDSTTFKFLAAYPDESTCRAAYLSGNGNGSHNGNGNGTASQNGATAPAPQASAATGQAPTNGNAGNGSNKAKETAWKFAEALIRQEKGDRARVSEKLAKMTLVNQYFTFDSPEVQELLMQLEFDRLNK